MELDTGWLIITGCIRRCAKWDESDIGVIVFTFGGSLLLGMSGRVGGGNVVITIPFRSNNFHTKYGV
jgi:hypothetical protein